MKYYTLLLVLLCCALAACLSVKPVYYEQEISKADAAVGKFHQLLNEGKYEELYDLTDEEAKKIKSKTDFLSVMEQVHTQFGKVSEAAKIDAKATSQAASTKIEMVYQTKFEKAELKEKFVWIVSDKNVGLYAYEIGQ
jgi:hypothetical protein